MTTGRPRGGRGHPAYSVRCVCGPSPTGGHQQACRMQTWGTPAACGRAGREKAEGRCFRRLRAPLGRPVGEAAVVAERGCRVGAPPASDEAAALFGRTRRASGWMGASLSFSGRDGARFLHRSAAPSSGRKRGRRAGAHSVTARSLFFSGKGVEAWPVRDEDAPGDV